MAWTYMLRCTDGSFYVGLTRHDDLEERVNQHGMGGDPKAYTFKRRPVELVWAEWFDLVADAIAVERRLKGWSRAKKMALIKRDYDEIQRLSKRGFRPADQ